MTRDRWRSRSRSPRRERSPERERERDRHRRDRDRDNRREPERFDGHDRDRISSRDSRYPPGAGGVPRRPRSRSTSPQSRSAEERRRSPRHQKRPRDEESERGDRPRREQSPPMSSPDWDADESHQADDTSRDNGGAGQPHAKVVVDAALCSMISNNQVLCRRCREQGSGADYYCNWCGEQRQCWDALLIRFQGLEVTTDAIRQGLIARGFPSEWIRHVSPVVGAHGTSRGMAIVAMENVAAATAVLAMCKFIEVRTTAGTSAKLRVDRDGRRLFAARQERRGAQDAPPKQQPFAPQWSTADELQRILDAIFSEWETANDSKKEFYNAHIPILNDLRYKEREQQEALEVAGQAPLAEVVSPSDAQEPAAAPSPTASAPEAAKSALQDRLARLREQKKKAELQPSTSDPNSQAGAADKAALAKSAQAPAEPSSVTALKPIPYPPPVSFNNYVSGQLETRHYDRFHAADAVLEMPYDMFADAMVTLRCLVGGAQAAATN